MDTLVHGAKTAVRAELLPIGQKPRCGQRITLKTNSHRNFLHIFENPENVENDFAVTGLFTKGYDA